MKSIPESEFSEVTKSIMSHPEYMTGDYMLDAYKGCGLEVIPDPFSQRIITPIQQALSMGRPFSVVRIGDGEANILSYGAYPKTPCLNRHVVQKIIAMQKDRFEADHLWMVILKDLMMEALLYADMIGVIGLWRPRLPVLEDYAQRALKNPRGVTGNWRSMDHMLRLAGGGTFDGKTLTSAHLYFSVLENLEQIIAKTNNIYILSDRTRVSEKLSIIFPEKSFVAIKVGNSEGVTSDREPGFLMQVYSSLPADMSGSLTLVGAGPWAEIYCTWIKQRGGVAVDLGSGFDILDGDFTRPVHQMINLDRMRAYFLK